ncbi:hypothetical protein BDR04DRAFT_1123518, partial [Suillus decipiens]
MTLDTNQPIIVLLNPLTWSICQWHQLDALFTTFMRQAISSRLAAWNILYRQNGGQLELDGMSDEKPIHLDGISREAFELFLNLTFRSQLAAAEEPIILMHCRLHTTSIPMKAGDHNSDDQKMGAVGQCVMRSVLNDTPSNILVIVGIHSNAYSSILKWDNKHTTSEIVQTHLGKPLWTAMKAASLAAREDETMETTINGGIP